MVFLTTFILQSISIEFYVSSKRQYSSYNLTASQSLFQLKSSLSLVSVGVLQFLKLWAVHTVIAASPFLPFTSFALISVPLSIYSSFPLSRYNLGNVSGSLPFTQLFSWFGVGSKLKLIWVCFFPLSLFYPLELF